MSGLGLRILGVLAAVAITTLVSDTLEAQGRKSPAQRQTEKASGREEVAGTKAWTPPRTPHGDPDLQGVWISRSATPLERPKALEGRDRLTDREVVELRQRADRIFKTGNSDFGAGDAVFLAALADSTEYRNPNATHGAIEMVDREFDNHTSLVTDPPDGRIPPLTPAARQRQVALAAAAQRPTGAESLTNAHRCITWTVPRLGGRYGAGDLAYYRILQSRGYVVLYFETGDEARIIPVDPRPHLPHTIAQWNGDSRGRWEGNTLVVETTNFSSKSNFMGAADGLHLIERFTRVAPDVIKYEMTFSDPTTWTRPWSAEIPLKQVDADLYEFACHEGNYEMVAGMLGAARADERRAR